MKFAYLIEPPFNYVDADGRLTGCDVELARRVVQELGGAAFEPVETVFSALLPGLGGARWQMTTGLFATTERRRIALFSRPVWALADGFLVRQGNPLVLSGYRSVADNGETRLAVIRDQFQHRSAVEFGVREDRIVIFETYEAAAKAVLDGSVDAYASVGRAHEGFVRQHPDWPVEVVLAPKAEKLPAFGAFAFKLDDMGLVGDVDQFLSGFLGSAEHRKMVAPFGFTEADVDLTLSWSG